MYLVVAHQKAGTEPQSARRMGLISLVLSGVGIVTGIILIIVLVVLVGEAVKNVRHFLFRSNLSKQFLFNFT